ncbi:hypothetical protein [Actinomadura chibensis]|uniref:Uncharacterized protein n=1 Tax=Actinomadura chibensis TaxID=392828 RepID=A0A5D0NUF7_9ACTN|nr:hypothetical protein [Actinomadura chibensis]TYB47808.1 hypothetical protein FXF69_00685 [Actinomadura chibensis]
MRDFEDVGRGVGADVDRAAAPGAQMPAVTLLLLGAGARALLGLLPAPLGAAPPLVLGAVVVVAAVGGAVVTYRTGPGRDVDWASADAYERDLLAEVPEDVGEVLVDAQTKIGGRMPTAAGVHLYVVRPAHWPCAIDGGDCNCARTRLSATLVPSRRHPVLLIGHRLLDEPIMLAYVLAGEVAQAGRVPRTLHLLLGAPLLAAWFVLGVTGPPHLLAVLAPALWLVTTAVRWGVELRADILAASTTGPRVARDYWARVRAASPPPTRTSRLLELISTHPPIAVRAALTAHVPGRSPISPT